ncbi:hypothetical protein [Tabrizicola sp.]|uniref:hypothetical protein n=1 Tax=Tabrizicola sp. TaxID=2005166 RepID=UPI003F2E94BC
MMIHSTDSSLREQYLEYGFLAAICREMWKRGEPVDVLHSHTDRSGYDLLLEANGLQRHIQLKSSFAGSKTARQTINTRLADRPGGCIVWIRFDPTSLDAVDYFWFGGAPGEPTPSLGDRVGRHSKGNADGIKAEKPEHRVLGIASFERLATADVLAQRLFGPPPGYLVGTQPGIAATGQMEPDCAAP